MKKIIMFVITLLLSVNITYAKTTSTHLLGDVLKTYNVAEGSIAISVKNVNDGKVLYEHNDKMLLNPASVQKILTTPAIVDTLGYDYKFKTQLYKRGADSYLLKLGADPYLTSDNLSEITANVSEETKYFYIDGTILDGKVWGEGWQWDDDLNVHTPRFGSYNLDGNLVKVTIIPSKNGGAPLIVNYSKYPIVFYNKLTEGAETKIEVHRDTNISSNTVIIEGVISEPTVIYLPVNNLTGYFNSKLRNSLEDNHVYLKNGFMQAILSKDDKFQCEIEHDINSALDDILKNSNNMVTETLFKLAGRKYAGLSTGTDKSGIDMFENYCKKIHVDSSKIRITDASGVSKNNLVSSDFVTDFLIANKDNPLYDRLATPGEGTLSLRMLPIKNNLKAKTGTLSNVSSLAGFLTSKSGKKYAFCIINNDISLSPSDKKIIEDYIVREIYLKY